MKKIYLLTLVIVFSCLGSMVHAQSSSFRKGEISINPGLSFGLIGYGWGYGSAGFPVPITVNVGYGVTEEFSVGGYVGYLGRSYGPVGDRDKFTSLSLGVQGAFHASRFLNENLDMSINEEKVDIYAKAILGFETYYWTNNGVRLDSGIYSPSGRLRFGPVLGTRYMIKPNFGVYAEGGRGTFGFLTLGVSLRL